MDKLFLLTLLLVIAAAVCNVIPPSQPQPAPTPLSAEDQALVDVYVNFTVGVAKALADNMVEIQTQQQPPPPITSTSVESSEDDSCDTGIEATSAFGLGQLLAVLNERIWTVGIPVFQELLTSTPKTLPDSFEFIFKKLLQSPDITFSSVIFTSENPTMTPNLNKLKVEVVNTDLAKSESVDTINNYLTKFLGKPMDESYIPKDATISAAAKAVLIDTLHVSESWGSSMSKVATPPKFNGVETVEMVEIVGSFPVMENNNAIEVLVPFKNSGRALSLILPKVSPTGSYNEPKLQNYTSVRVQLPVFNGTIRNFQANLTTLCNFKPEANFVQILDHVVVISLDQEKFETISITGLQINDASKFKTLKSKDKSLPTCDSAPRVSVPPPVLKPTDPTPATAEKLLTFDRTFSWTLLDRDFGPIMAGSVDLPATPPQKNAVAPPPSSYTFGLENQLAYAKCL